MYGIVKQSETIERTINIYLYVVVLLVFMFIFVHFLI